MAIDPDQRAELEAILAIQNGVVARRQLLRLGLPREYGSDRVASGAWQPVLDGVYLTHTGELGFLPRCWAAVLHAGPGAVLAGESAGRLSGLTTSSGTRIVVVVPHDRRVRGPGWLTIHRRRRPSPGTGLPPRTSLEVTVLDLCEEIDDVDRVVSLVATVARRQRTTAHLTRELAARRTSRHRRLLRALLGEPGIESVLEHHFLRGVVDAHGLPRPVLQRRDRVEGRTIRSDAAYEEWGTRVELDGRVHLESTDDDAWRDAWVAVTSGDLTLRLRWRHVLANPCRSAALVARGLRRGGWNGTLRPCGPGCTALTDPS